MSYFLENRFYSKKIEKKPCDHHNSFEMPNWLKFLITNWNTF